MDQYDDDVGFQTDGEHDDMEDDNFRHRPALRVAALYRRSVVDARRDITVTGSDTETT